LVFDDGRGAWSRVVELLSGRFRLRGLKHKEVMSRQRLWTLIGLCCAVVALLLLASSLSELRFRPGRFYDLSALLPAMDGTGVALSRDPGALGFWQTLLSRVSLVLLVCLVIGLIFSRKLRRELLRRVISILIVLILFYQLLNVLRGNPAQEQGFPAAANDPLPPLLGGESLPAFVANPTPWLIALVSAALLALLLGGIWFFWRRLHTREAPLARLADEAQVALADLQSGSDLKDVVLRCYMQMSQILSEQRGITRPRDMTPREFARQLAAVGLRDEHIGQLTRLFERVRYGARQAGEREEREAITCLTAIAQAYARSP
jgi:hypothetical protein